MELKKTPLYQRHLRAKARIVDFSGWALPVEYTSMLEEAQAVRSSCGLFDASHMGEILIEGSKAFDFLQRLVSNDLSLIGPGQMQYNLFLNQAGGIIDDLMVYRKKDSFLCVVNASNKDKVLEWLNQNLIPDIKIIDQSLSLALVSLQGPNSQKLIKKVFGQKASSLDYLHFSQENIAGREILISRSGYTSEDGFEMYTPWDEAIYLWDRLKQEGEGFGLALCGLGSRDILRIEAGYPLYGQEIDETTNPYEAGLGWAVKLNKDFIGKSNIADKKAQGSSRKRMGFVMQERSYPRQGYLVYSQAKKIGQVSSGTFSPNLGKFIGMAYIEKDWAKNNTPIQIKIREQLRKAELKPFTFIESKVKGKKQLTGG